MFDGGSLAGFRALTAGDRGALAPAGTLAVAGTTAGTLASGRRHASACATTLIVALGLLTSARDPLGVGRAGPARVRRHGRRIAVTTRSSVSTQSNS